MFISVVLCALGAGCGDVHFHFFDLPAPEPVEIEDRNEKPKRREIILPPLPSEKAEIFGRARRYSHVQID